MLKYNCDLSPSVNQKVFRCSIELKHDSPRVWTVSACHTSQECSCLCVFGWLEVYRVCVWCRTTNRLKITPFRTPVACDTLGWAFLPFVGRRPSTPLAGRRRCPLSWNRLLSTWLGGVMYHLDWQSVHVEHLFILPVTADNCAVSSSLPQPGVLM